DQRSQSPSLNKTNEEHLKNGLGKIQTSTSTSQPKLGQKQQPPQLLQTSPKANEKEIHLHKISTPSTLVEDVVDNAIKPQIKLELKQDINVKASVTSPKQSKTPITQKQSVETKTVNKKLNIPQFHFPSGRPDEKKFKNDADTMKLVSQEFKQVKDGKMSKDEFAQVCKLIGLPKFWKILLFRTCTNTSKLNYLTFNVFEQTWTKLSQSCFDRVTLFMKLIAPNANYIVYEDWEPLLQDIVDSHPGLKFLHDHKEFHTRYIKTVIARIYYTVNRSWSGRITHIELKRSNLLNILEILESEDDINLIKDYFSYEHFYVIYCKFWELDKDHDLYISKEDLYRHNNYSISPRVIDRIFSGTVLKGRDWRDGLMSYYDFVWFLISEEDKRNQTSIEYWFRVLDVDGDGILSMYELEYFYLEQMEQMRERQIEYMPFNDLLCQMLDLVKPQENGKIRLKDLKQCKMANVFFDTFINLEKYLEYEQRDPFANMKDLDGPEQSDWEKYAAYEYENLVSEDVNGDNQEGYNNYDEDFEDEPMMYNNTNQNEQILGYCKQLPGEDYRDFYTNLWNLAKYAYAYTGEFDQSKYDYLVKERFVTGLNEPSVFWRVDAAKPLTCAEAYDLVGQSYARLEILKRNKPTVEQRSVVDQTELRTEQSFIPKRSNQYHQTNKQPTVENKRESRFR
ncbi:unnamed protein product, partial [Brachionus calyciflorus]